MKSFLKMSVVAASVILANCPAYAAILGDNDFNGIWAPKCDFQSPLSEMSIADMGNAGIVSIRADGYARGNIGCDFEKVTRKGNTFTTSALCEGKGHSVKVTTVFVKKSANSISMDGDALVKCPVDSDGPMVPDGHD